MLPADNRLRRNSDIRAVYAARRTSVDPMLVLHYRPTGGRQVRIGFSVAKKLGCAVVRNRVKRRLRSIIRAWVPSLRHDVDIVVVARTVASGASEEELRTAVRRLLDSAGLWVTGERPSECATPLSG